MRTRRGFLSVGAGALLVAALPLPALAADEAWVVSYLWSRTLSRVIAHRKRVADLLGPEVGRGLVVVRGPAGPWGLVDDVSCTDPEAVKQLAAARDEQLRSALGGTEVLATGMPDVDLVRTCHVGYGALPDEAEARARFDVVGRLLGPDVKAALVLQAADGAWETIYPRYGDPAGTEAVASRHAAILVRAKVSATVIPDRYVDPAWALAPVATLTPVEVAPEPVPEPVVEVAEPNAVHALEGRQSVDLPATSKTPLRDAINAHVQGLRKQGLIDPDETTSWYVQTLHDDRTWAAINADRSLQCASMVKPYVALAFLHRVDEGRIVYGPTSRSRLEAMIQYSSNTATNWAMATVGGPAAVQRILTEHYAHLLPETSITETIPRSGRTYKNRSSARDYVRFSRALWRDELPRSAELKRLMSLPGHDRLYTGASGIPTCTQVMNKTGTTAQLCGDFGILVAQTPAGEKVPYAIVGIIEKGCSATSYSTWVASRTKVIRGVSNLAYQVLKAHYHLV